MDAPDRSTTACLHLLPGGPSVHFERQRGSAVIGAMFLRDRVFSCLLFSAEVQQKIPLTFLRLYRCRILLILETHPPAEKRRRF